MEIEWKKMRRRIAGLEFDLRALEGQNALTRSQLSEALNKLREYREAEECVESERNAPAAMKALGLIGMLNSLAHRARRESEFFKRTGAGTRDVGSRTDDELRPLKDRLIEAGCIGPIAAKIAAAYDRQPPWGTKAEQVLIQIVRKGQFSREDFLMLVECAPWIFQRVRAAIDAFEGLREGSLPIGGLVAQMWEPEDEAQPIPHHGPGLSEAEDAFKADLPMKGEDDGVTVQYRGEPTRMSFEEAVKLQEIKDQSAPFLNAGRVPIVQAGDFDEKRPAGVVGKNESVTGIDPESGLNSKVPRSFLDHNGVLKRLSEIDRREIVKQADDASKDQGDEANSKYAADPEHHTVEWHAAMSAFIGAAVIEVEARLDGDIKHSHYKKDVSHLDMLDIYRVLSLFQVESHAVGHAIKKLMLAGKRGAKDYGQDIQEAIDSLNRELQMIAEDE